MIGRGLIKKLVAGFAAAGAALVAMVATGATLFYSLTLLMHPAGAAAITAGVFALISLGLFLFMAGKADGGRQVAEPEYEEPEGLGGRAYALFRSRPILGTVAALAGGWIVLRNPALATIVAAAFTERTRGPRRYR
jgi:hypothetical protein